MRAAVLSETGGPEQVTVQEVPDPTPGSGEVRVAIRAAALNRRDVWITLGRYPGIRLPCILGSDGAGVIDAVGEGVDAGQVGREVVIYPAFDWGEDPKFPSPGFRILGMPDPGTFAEYVCVPAENCHDKPPHLDWEHAAALPLAGLTAWRAVSTQAGVARGERVLVTGIGGGVATMALQFVVHKGARAWVSSSSEAKRERARTLGAEGGVDYRDEDWAKVLREATGGGVDAVIDGTAGPTFRGCFDSLVGGGRLVVYGATAGDPPEPLPMARLFFRQVRIQGSTMGTPQEFAEMLAFVRAERIEPLVDRVFPLDEAAAAHQHLYAAGHMGKVVLKP